MSNLTKIDGGIVLSKPLQFDPDKRLFELKVSEFQQLMRDSFPVPQLPSIEKQENHKRFINEYEARCRLSGDYKKPISKPTFNKLRRENKFTTFFPSPGRVAFDLDDIDEYIATTKSKASSILTKRKNR